MKLKTHIFFLNFYVHIFIFIFYFSQNCRNLFKMQFPITMRVKCHCEIPQQSISILIGNKSKKSKLLLLNLRYYYQLGIYIYIILFYFIFDILGSNQQHMPQEDFKYVDLACIFENVIPTRQLSISKFCPMMRFKKIKIKMQMKFFVRF